MASLALKYRPQNFQDLVGQLHAAQSLKNAIEHKQIGQAYLFFGSRGVGKTSTARILAKALNCEKGPTTEICGECEFCKEITGGHCTDVYEMDAASNRGIENIRNLREAVRFPPLRARYKIYIIDEVHMLSSDAFNALLKTLEEPPPHAVFILATTEKHKVPETILSRCQSYDFRKFTLKEIQDRLAHILQNENIQFESLALVPIAEKAEGSMRDAISLMDQSLAFSGKEQLTADKVRTVLGILPDEIFIGFLSSVRTHDTRNMLSIISEIHTKGGNLKRFVWDFLVLVKEMVSVKENAFLQENEADKERYQRLSSEAGLWDSSDLVLVFEYFFKLYSGWTFYHTARSNEIKISFEVALFDILHKLRSPSLSTLIRKMDSLKKAIETGNPSFHEPEEQEEKKKSGLIEKTHLNAQTIEFTSHKSKEPSSSNEKLSVETQLEKPVSSKEMESILIQELLAEEGNDPYIKDLFQ